MKNFNIFLYGVVAAVCATALFTSCSGSGKAIVDCTIADAPESEVIVKLLDINQYEVLDTVKTNASGKFTYKIPLQRNQPEFIYLFYGDTKIASLLLQKDDKVQVSADTLGRYTVSGSEESVKLQQVENDLAAFSAKFMGLMQKADECESGSEEERAYQAEASGEYVKYYRDRVRYVLSNSHSLTVVPVLFQTIGTGLLLFSQQTDAIHFRNVCDSLETIYPDSRYVKALRKEAARRLDLMELSFKIDSAEQIDYLEIEMPDVNGVKRKLSDVDAKVIMLHFWSSDIATQKMYNIEVIKPVYDAMKDKGFDIYQIAFDTDKAAWARVVKDQGLGWINVCDGLGQYSPVISRYNLTSSPASFFIVNGDIVSGELQQDATALRRTVEKLLTEAGK